MTLWYAIWEHLPFSMLHWKFMCNALLTILLMAPLFGLCSTMIVSGKMSFFSDALGHSAFTGIAIGCILGISQPTWVAVIFSIIFALLFSFVRYRSAQAADTLIGVFSSTAVALGIFIATFNGGSFTKYNSYLIGDILSITPKQIAILAVVLMATIIYWVLFSNKLALISVYPQLAASRGVSVPFIQGSFTAFIAVVVTLCVSSVGLLVLNSLLVLPAAAARNLSKNLKQYNLLSISFALIAGVTGLTMSYYLSASAGAAISLILAVIFAVSFLFRKVRG